MSLILGFLHQFAVRIESILDEELVRTLRKEMGGMIGDRNFLCRFPALVGKIAFMAVLESGAIHADGSKYSSFEFKQLNVAGKDMLVPGMFAVRQWAVGYLCCSFGKVFDTGELNVALVALNRFHFKLIYRLKNYERISNEYSSTPKGERDAMAAFASV